MSYTFASNGQRFEQQERHCKEDALTDYEFELLYEGAQRLPDEYYRLQSMFVVLVAGRLGLRRAEIAHMDGSWVDWDDKFISIPSYEDCDCGDCRQKAQQKAECNEEITEELEMDCRWHPKTESGVRDVPFGFSSRVEVVVDRFFDKYDEYPLSVMSVTRRIERAVDNAEGLEDCRVYPHSLRATAATYHVGRGLSVPPLKSMLGWCDFETPDKYVQSNGKNTARELRNIHNR